MKITEDSKIVEEEHNITEEIKSPVKVDELQKNDGADKKKKKKAAVESPITQVLFSNFIVQ